jgi:23S rRNA U2552 (ribose-2'-O)-methylase RlmE/FtsJ
MKYFTINKNHTKKICLTDIINPIIFDVFHQQLIETKKTIDSHIDKWNLYRSHENIYEYIYSSSDNSKNICKILPISRSYFKLQEIIIDLDILQKNQMTITCIAEGPGGFIQCINHNSNNKYNIYGITLISKERNIPYWSPIIEKYKNVILLKGIDNTGDICNIDNINNFVSIIGSNTCDLITSDGGIDYSDDYNSQEINSYKFIFFEIYTTLQIQKQGGTFILKMFDLLYHTSIQLIYILYLCYDEIYIHKPYMSRNSNSEKYIVCKGYRLNTVLMEVLKNNIINLNSFYLEIPESFIENIHEFNEYYITKQICTIKFIIENIEKNLSVNKYPSNLQIKKAKEWCNTYKLPLNTKCNLL